MKNALKTADLLFNSISLLQDRVFYEKTENCAGKCHQGEITRSIRHQSQGHHIEKQTHLMETYAEMEQHFQQLNADLLSSTKENERDMFDQRNQQFSTILLATTIMLSALVCCLAQGVLPNGSSLDSFIYNTYSVTTSLSVAFLFICLVFCVEVMWRASRFMYKRSKYHTGYLAKAIKKTKDMMSAIRGAKAKEKSSTTSNKMNSQGKVNVSDRPGASARRRNISKMSEKDIEKEFVSYEHEINYYHKNREAMIDDSAYMVTADDGSMVESKSFEKFWQDSCSFYGNTAVLSFYAGSAALFFANVTYMWAVNLYDYKSLYSAKICVVVVLGSLMISLALLIYMRYIEKISMENRSADDESEVEKFSWGAFRATMATLSSRKRLGREGSLSRGFGRMSTFLASNRQLSEGSESSEGEGEGEGDHDIQNQMNSNDGGHRGTAKKRDRRLAALPIARTLDIPLHFPGNYGDTSSDASSSFSMPLPKADAAFPCVALPVGVLNQGLATPNT